ncbi:hypothetical protein GF420_15475 [candidate division GN15 bacterium]|nr:hypothetical protein [candidate division GN15 bacterium]
MAVGTIVFGASLVASRLIWYNLGLTPIRLPQQADESAAVAYLLIGSLLLSAGLLPLVRGMGGTVSQRSLTTAVFFYVAFGVAVSIESAIYASVGGFDRMILVFLLPCLALSLVYVASSEGGERRQRFLEHLRRMLASRPASAWAWRVVVSVAAFPIIYLVFGIIAAPLVMEFYREAGLGLTVPSIGTILGVQLLRSAMFLVVTIPILLFWVSSRRRLILALGLAHFVFVFAYDIVLAYQLPISLVLTHGVEILLDSIVYAWVFVSLLRAGSTTGTGGRGSADSSGDIELREQHPTR